jgi:hypothetical protein
LSCLIQFYLLQSRIKKISGADQSGLIFTKYGLRTAEGNAIFTKDEQISGKGQSIITKGKTISVKEQHRIGEEQHRIGEEQHRIEDCYR